MNPSIFGAAMLIAGTSIGAGMLGLPIATQSLGFFGALVAFLLAWGVMVYSAFLLTSVAFRLRDKVNLLSMVNARTHKVVGFITQLCYLFFFYSLLASYTAGAFGLFQVTGQWANVLAPTLFGLYLVVLCIGPRYVDWFNRILMLGLFIAYMGLTLYTVEDAPTLWPETFSGGVLPIVVLSFGFHHLIPTLRDYLKDERAVKRAILIGSALPLLVYIVWEYIALGALSPGDDLTKMLAGQGSMSAGLGRLVWAFSLFSLLSSFVGVSFGLFDFIKDSTKVRSRLPLALLTLAPPAIYAASYPEGFMMALNYAGSFAGYLLIVLPAVLAFTFEKGARRAGPALLALFGLAVMLS